MVVGLDMHMMWTWLDARQINDVQWYTLISGQTRIDFDHDINFINLHDSIGHNNIASLSTVSVAQWSAYHTVVLMRKNDYVCCCFFFFDTLFIMQHSVG